METSFKLTVRQEVHYKVRAYQWLEAIVDAAPLEFWVERKKRVIKSLYTHSIDLAKIQKLDEDIPPKTQAMMESYKEYALKIALKFQQITKFREFDEY